MSLVSEATVCLKASKAYVFGSSFPLVTHSHASQGKMWQAFSLLLERCTEYVEASYPWSLSSSFTGSPWRLFVVNITFMHTGSDYASY